MVQITLITIVNALIFSNVFIVFFLLLSGKQGVLVCTSLRVFAVLVGLFLLRLFLPVEFLPVQVISSETLFPWLIETLKKTYSVSFFGGAAVEIRMQSILLALWWGGAVVAFCRRMHGYYFMTKRLASVPETDKAWCLELLEKTKEAGGYRFPTKLMIHEGIPMVMEFGLRKQTILLPEGTYGEEELSNIFAHELEHFRNGTNWFKLFISMIEVFFWWNPLMGLFHQACDYLLEIHCDSGVTKKMSFEERQAYLHCLLKNMRRSLGRKRSRDCVSYLSRSGKGEALKMRCQLVLEHKVNRMREAILMLGMVLVFIGSYTIMIQPTFAPPKDAEEDLFLSPEDDYRIEYENGAYWLYLENELFLMAETEQELYEMGLIIK